MTMFARKLIAIASVFFLSGPALSVELDLNDRSVTNAGSASQSHKSWQVAEAVSEKEAFDLAKDVGTVSGWDAFLKSFPTGFRADLARSYIKKIKSAPPKPDVATRPPTQPTPNTTTSGTSQPTIQYIEAATLYGAYSLRARAADRVHINNNDTGVVTAGSGSPDSKSSHWFFEEVAGTKYVRIRNRWKGTYLFVEEGVVQALPRKRSDTYSQWILEVPRTSANSVIIRNRETGEYLGWQKGAEFLTASSGLPRVTNGHWRLVEVREDRPVVNKPATTSKPKTTKRVSVRCSGGYIRKGSCRCSKGKRRIRLGSNNYRCKRIKTVKKKKKKRSKKSCFEAGCSSFCGPGYMMLRGKCYTMPQYYKLLEAQEG